MAWTAGVTRPHWLSLPHASQILLEGPGGSHLGEQAGAAPLILLFSQVTCHPLRNGQVLGRGGHLSHSLASGGHQSVLSSQLFPAKASKLP